MKAVLLMITLTASTIAFTKPSANPCETKKAEITKEIAQAKLHNHKEKVAGLEKALSEVTAYCTPEKVAKDHQEKVNKLQKKVDERMEELKKAEATGKAKKIEKAQQKLKEAEAEFQANK